MAKISDYPEKNFFKDGDLYDCSSIYGSVYDSEKVTFSALKNAIIDGLVPQTITKIDLTIADIETSPTFTSGSFTSISAFSDGKFGYAIMGKIMHVFVCGYLQFSSGGTGGIFTIQPPTGLPIVDDDLTSANIFGSSSPLSFNYNTFQGVTQKQGYQLGQASYLYKSTNPGLQKMIFSITDMNTDADSIFFSAQGTIPVI